MLLTAVLSVAPANNSHVAPIGADAVLNFDAEIDAATVDLGSLVVHQSQRGLLADATVTTIGMTITVDPTTDFFAGELISVTATGLIQSTPGVPADPRVWQFRTSVAPSAAEFFSGQLLGDHYSSFASLGDLDGDGDLDAFVTNLGNENRIWLNDEGTFSDSGQLLGRHYSYGVSLGDLDGDGDLDAFVANADSNRVWLNTDSVFTDSGQLLGSHDSNRVALGDLDGDGDLDAFVANYSQANRIWLNDSGVFIDSGQILGNHASFDVDLGDLDNDGDLDAYVANVYQGNRVWLNTGGEFTDSLQDLGTGLSFAVDLGDVDNDGDLDAFVGNSGYQGDSVWLNDAGTFTDSGQAIADHLTQAVALGDLDGDGDLDAFTATGGSYDSHVWVNDGGIFTANGQDLFENAPSLGVALGDVDNDGDLDVFVANFTRPNTVWINEQALPLATLDLDNEFISEDGGIATFSVALSAVATEPVSVDLGLSGTAEIGVDYTTTALQVVIAPGSDTATVSISALQDTLGESDETVIVDILAVENGRELGEQRQTTTIVDDGDARLNVVGTTPEVNSHSAPPSTNIEIDFDQSVDATTATLQEVTVHTSQSGRIVDASGSVNTAGQTVTIDPVFDFFPGEIVQVNVSTALRSSEGAAATPRLWQFRAGVTAGSGIFEESGQSLGVDRSADVALGDFDQDGDLDAFVANLQDGNRILRNDNGVLVNSGQSLGDSLSLGVAIGDLDGDGDLDAYVTNYYQANRVWLNEGGVFTDTLQTLGDHSSIRVELGDLDNDGDLDAFVVNYAQGNRVWINDSGVFSDSGQELGTANSYGVALGDLDGDGDLDAFVANLGESNRIWLNEAGEFVDSGQILGNHLSSGVALGDLDGDGDLDAFVANLAQANRLWLNADGTFTDSGQLLGGEVSANATLGDVDGDGDLDVFVANSNQPNRLWLNDAGQLQESGQNIGAHASAGVALGDLDGDGDLDALSANYNEPNRVWFNQARVEPNALLVEAVIPTPSGVTIDFASAFDPSVLNLFDTELGALGMADLVLQGSSSGTVAGSLVVDQSLQSVTFVKTGEPLAPDTYSLTLRSGANGFRDTAGNLLDGDGDGVVGDDFMSTFVVAEPAPGTVVVGLPDFVRGPGQPVNLPASSAAGIPLAISDGANVRTVTVEVHYDPALLEITDATLGSSLPAGATIAIDATPIGITFVNVTSPSDLPAGGYPLVHLVAAVPAGDASAIYGQQQVIELRNLVVSDTGGSQIPVIPDSAYHSATFFGDVSGNGRVNSSDASQVARLAALLDSGFRSSLLADPMLAGDISGNGRINAADASRVARFAALIPVPEIPPLPSGVTIAGRPEPDSPSVLVGLILPVRGPVVEDQAVAGVDEVSRAGGTAHGADLLEAQRPVTSSSVADQHDLALAGNEDFTLDDLEASIAELLGQ